VAGSRRNFPIRFLSLFLALSLFPQPSSLGVIYISYDEAQPILDALADVLPEGLKSVRPSDLPSVWAGWIERRDTDVRARLAQGDEDSIVNLLLFGVSFTHRPRLTQANLERLASQDHSSASSLLTNKDKLLGEVLEHRIDDFLEALATPGSNERLLLARRFLELRGYHPGDVRTRPQIRLYLLGSLARVLKEQANYARLLDAARSPGNSTEEFARRSKLYRDRGLSLDTSLGPNFALEESLKAIRARGLLAAGGVRRVGIIGPGLDFADKDAGYDFYPQQTVQPFALIDTLLRLGLAQADTIEVTTFDISPRVNDHLTRALARAHRGIGYTVELPLGMHKAWKSEMLRYWERFGDQVGVPVRPVSIPPGVGKVKIRAVRIRPAVVARVKPIELNIVLQHLDLPSGGDRFDLIVATNVFVYYDVFEQSLALTNVEHMLRPGGFLLSNNALLELPASQMRSVDYLTVVYSDRPGDGDHIVWYQRRKG
jgi:hypothetical protein